MTARGGREDYGLTSRDVEAFSSVPLGRLADVDAARDDAAVGVHARRETSAAPREQGRLLTTLGDFRQEADYGFEPLDVDVTELIERTGGLVDAMSTLVEETGADEP